MIGIVNYDAGNIASVANALSSIGAEFEVSNDPGRLARCHGIILPGVGAAPGAMASLERLGLEQFLSTTTLPLLGICLGMQVLYEQSDEGPVRCLGVLAGTVRRYDDRIGKVPHMGWNIVEQSSENPLMEGIRQKEYFYFAHSYYAVVGAWTTSVTNNPTPFSAAVARENIFGVQFHPEKSGAAGLRILKNFAGLCRSFPQ